MSRPALVFIGFMGAGKSTALAAAQRAGLETTEIDAVMEVELGMKITEAFARLGEEGFRAREAEVVGSLLERADGGAIALGGGSILSERIRAALERHVVVWLRVDAQESWRRIAHSDRPLATNADDVARLMEVREPLYEELADAVIPVGDRAIVSRALPALIALLDLPAETRMLWAASASGEYPVLVGPGLLDALVEPSSGSGWWPASGRRFGIADATTASLYAERLRPLAAVSEIQPGEASKTMAIAEGVLRELARAEMTKEDHVVALGGGVVGDLAGLCAHLYQRGVPVVQVPTTLVAQVDSAYGGKTGVDLPEGKNYAGAYHLPAAVISDTATLATLPSEELAAGFVEVLKTGLLAGGALWERVRGLDSLGDSAALADVVFACARFKCEIVAADERDGGLRHMLNFGHTVGHAIEAATGYQRFRHGEAVGLGLLAALRLSDADELRAEVERSLLSHRLPVRLDQAVPIDAVLDALQRDKKRTAAGVGFVLLAEPGEPRVGQLVDPARVRGAVEELIG
ncbi:MAG TPA: bifunctional shikimate kinase/3-dehydroquinate synthase [Solirubrobacterales bacterium]|jgi:shikimate kinase/3-dehydroquinate synthase|nr:bifunctional shikimate kinase/3-dehydroquinate synthase [Solirubrobacterales bacterium]